MEKCLRKNKGVTLLALAISIVIIIILSVIAINAAVGENGLVRRAEMAKDETEKESAREELEMVLADAFAEKYINKEYNKNDFLDEFIKQRIEKVEVLGDIVTINGYSFEINRNVPEIGNYLGKFEELTFPTITTEVVLATDSKTADIVITAREEESGINKIEIIQEDEILETYTYDNVKEEIKETYTAKNIGTYAVKVYSKANMSQYVRVEGIIPVVNFFPNGSKEYKKEYSINLSAQESIDEIKSIKYQWLQTVVEPSADSFKEMCSNNETITEKNLTGTWYLWALVETENGKTNINRSEAFNFDNTGPVTTLTSTPVSENSFTLTSTARDDETQVASYKFYVNNELKETVETNEGTASYTVTGEDMGEVECYVIATDRLGNETKQTVTARTQMYTWERWNCTTTTIYTLNGWTKIENRYIPGNTTGRLYTKEPGWNNITNIFSLPKNVSTCKFGTAYGYSWTVYMLNSGSSLLKYVPIFNQKNTFQIFEKKVVESITDSKGTIQYEDATSTSSTEYPTNGKSGEYWYVYKGIQ